MSKLDIQYLIACRVHVCEYDTDYCSHYDNYRSFYMGHYDEYIVCIIMASLSNVLFSEINLGF